MLIPVATENAVRMPGKVVKWRPVRSGIKEYCVQTSANWGHDSRFVSEASRTRLSPKPSRNQVIKVMLLARGEG